MKGITPVIAIILLLLITISMVGFAFVWFTQMMTTTTNRTQTQANTQMDQQQMRIRITSVDTVGAAVYITNVGGINIPTNMITVFVNNIPVTCVWTPTATIAVGATAGCDWGAGPCAGGSAIKVISPGTPSGDIAAC